jgi:hypothetical protein
MSLGLVRPWFTVLDNIPNSASAICSHHLGCIKARECRPISANARWCARMLFFGAGVDVALM